MNNPFVQALSAALNYAIVSHQVSRDAAPIGFLYREAAAFEHDSGWRFFSGMEDDDYVENVAHFDTLPLSDVLDANPEIETLMVHTSGAWEWDDVLEDFVAVSDWQHTE